MAAAVVSLAVRAWLLAKRPLWHDEVFTAWISRLSPGEIIRSLRQDSGPPLFYFLEKPVSAAVEAFGLVDETFRALPFLAAALVFAMIRWLPGDSRRRFLWLAATSPFLLLYSGEARAYSLLALPVFLLFRLTVRENPSAGRLVAIAAVAAALPWTHYLGLFAAASLLAADLAGGRPKQAGAIAGGLALFLPWVPVIASQPRAATSWIQDSAGVSLTGFLGSLGGGVRVLPPFGRPLPAAASWAAAAAGAAAIAILVARCPDPESRIALATVLLTLTGILAVSLFRPVAIAGRTEMAVLPIWLWVLARAGETSRAARAAAVVIAAIGFLSCAWILASPRSARPFADVPRELTDSARPGDLVVASANFYLPARLAHDRGRLAAELEGLPPNLRDHPGWFRGDPASEDDYRRLAGELARADRRVFFLIDPPYWTPRLEELVSAWGTPSLRRLPRYGLLISSAAPR